MTTAGFLGIDAGTQGLSVVLTDAEMRVLATGEGGYDMVPGLEEGAYEQRPEDWWQALLAAMTQLRSQLSTTKLNVAAIGISGQMHGEVLVNENFQPLKPARLWCDARNDAEGQELTELLGVKMPKRITAARWLWTLRQQPDVAQQARYVTTPGGWLAYCLTGEWNLGVGDAAGMFPIDQETLDYDAAGLQRFDDLARTAGATRSLREMLPIPRLAGQSGGQLLDSVAESLGLEAGIPVAPAEGDQPAALAGSLIGRPGMVSVSYGTSVCANSVGDRPFTGVDSAIDHFCAPDGKPINMVFLRNGTTFMNTVVEMFGDAIGGDRSEAFARLMPQVLETPADCGGLLALPFMDDEPGLGILQGGNANVYGLNTANAHPANAVKAALVATMFNLKLGSEVLERQGFPRTELVLSGGLTRTPELGQVLADICETPVTLLEGADEGSAWGASLLAAFRYQTQQDSSINWVDFLEAYQTTARTRFEPDATRVEVYRQQYQRYLERYRQVRANH